MTGFADSLKVGDAVMVDTCEGFGGIGLVVACRDSPTSHAKVRLYEGSQPDFWAHDFELSPIRPDGQGYDSRRDTLTHIIQVQGFLARVVGDIESRSLVHDRSKLASPEVEVFDEFTPKLAGSTYGSEEYKSFLFAMKSGLDHHYAANSHHPEHYEDGILGMSLLDLIEMLCDWKAATLRHADGDIRRSIEINQRRFGYSDELKQIFLNTLSAIEGD